MDRKVAELGLYPAIDVFKSTSRLVDIEKIGERHFKLIEEVLGEDYYTISPDVMNSDTEAYEDMIHRIKYLKETIKCKNILIYSQFIIIVIMVILLFLASIHIIF